MMNNKMGLTLGSDPEFMWMVSDTRPGRYSGMLPAKFILSKMKEFEYDVKEDGKSMYVTSTGGKMFADGASWEINPHPSDTPSIVRANIRDLLEFSYGIKKKLSSEDVVLTLNIQPSIPLDIEMLNVWGDPELTQFGCDVDKSIHPRIINPKDIDAATHPFRYCGGHIQFGIIEHLKKIKQTPETFFKDGGKNVYDWTLLCDATVGMVGILNDRIVEDSASQRREVYGQPGVYRVQPWGIEYRTPSNSWLLNSERAENMFYMSREIPELFEMGVADEVDWFVGDIRQALVTGDKGMAKDILTRVGEIVGNGPFKEDMNYCLKTADVAHMRFWTDEWNIG